ncbi:MAG: response regulator transcription factor [Erysipelotrichaceae bacterium]
MRRILIVDDEENITSLVKEYSSDYDYVVDEINDSMLVMDQIKNVHYDLVILDIMMPKMDGFSLAKKIKYSYPLIPIIMLSALESEDDKINCFDIGVDDYITKPFSLKELMARIKVVCDRYMKENNNLYEYETLTIDFNGYTLKVDNQLVDLTPKEFELLSLLVKNVDIALNRDFLIEKVWGYDYEKDDRTIDTHIKMLRNNLGRYRDLIVTVRSVGYKFVSRL